MNKNIFIKNLNTQQRDDEEFDKPYMEELAYQSRNKKNLYYWFRNFWDLTHGNLWLKIFNRFWKDQFVYNVVAGQLWIWAQGWFMTKQTNIGHWNLENISKSRFVKYLPNWTEFDTSLSSSIARDQAMIHLFPEKQTLDQLFDH